MKNREEEIRKSEKPNRIWQCGTEKVGQVFAVCEKERALSQRGPEAQGDEVQGVGSRWSWHNHRRRGPHYCRGQLSWV